MISHKSWMKGFWWKPALIKSLRGNYQQSRRETYIRACIDQVDIFLGHGLRHDTTLQAVNLGDRLLKDVHHELFWDSIGTHDHDKLAIEECHLVFGELESAKL